MWELRPHSCIDIWWGLVYIGSSALHSIQPFASLLHKYWVLFCIMWVVIVFHVAQQHCTSRLEHWFGILEVVEHHPGCFCCQKNAWMYIMFAYVWMEPSIVGDMVHLLVYALGGCSRLFTLSCMYSCLHCLNCTLGIVCNNWFVFSQGGFHSLGYLVQTNYLGKLPSVTWETVIKPIGDRIRPVT